METNLKTFRASIIAEKFGVSIQEAKAMKAGKPYKPKKKTKKETIKIEESSNGES